MSDDEYAVEALRRTRETVRRMQEANEANEHVRRMREEGEQKIAGWQAEARREAWFFRWLVMPFFVVMFLFVLYATLPIFIRVAVKAAADWRALLH
jgi:hypothetical protein